MAEEGKSHKERESTLDRLVRNANMYSQLGKMLEIIFLNTFSFIHLPVLPFKKCWYAAVILSGTFNPAGECTNTHFTERWPKTFQKKKSCSFCKSFLNYMNITLYMGFVGTKGLKRRMTKQPENKILSVTFCALYDASVIHSLKRVWKQLELILCHTEKCKIIL